MYKKTISSTRPFFFADHLGKIAFPVDGSQKVVDAYRKFGINLEKIETDESISELWVWQQWPNMLIVIRGESTARLAHAVLSLCAEKLEEHKGRCTVFLDFVDIVKHAAVQGALPLTQYLRTNKKKIDKVYLGIQSSIMGGVARAGASLADTELEVFSNRPRLIEALKENIRISSEMGSRAKKRTNSRKIIDPKVFARTRVVS